MQGQHATCNRQSKQAIHHSTRSHTTHTSRCKDAQAMPHASLCEGSMQHTERAEHQLRHLPTYAEHALENVVAQSERQPLQLPLEQLFQSVEPCHTDPCLVEYRALSPTSLVPSGTCMVPNATALRFPPSGTPRGTLSRPREHRNTTAGHAPVGQHAADSVPAVPRAHQRQTISCAL